MAAWGVGRARSAAPTEPRAAAFQLGAGAYRLEPAEPRLRSWGGVCCTGVFHLWRAPMGPPQPHGMGNGLRWNSSYRLMNDGLSFAHATVGSSNGSVPRTAFRIRLNTNMVAANRSPYVFESGAQRSHSIRECAAESQWSPEPGGALGMSSNEGRPSDDSRNDHRAHAHR